MNGISDLAAFGLDECVAHATADDQVINFVEQILQHAKLAGNLGTTNDGCERTFGVL